MNGRKDSNEEYVPDVLVRALGDTDQDGYFDDSLTDPAVTDSLGMYTLTLPREVGTSEYRVAIELPGNWHQSFPAAHVVAADFNNGTWLRRYPWSDFSDGQVGYSSQQVQLPQPPVANLIGLGTSPANGRVYGVSENGDLLSYDVTDPQIRLTKKISLSNAGLLSEGDVAFHPESGLLYVLTRDSAAQRIRLLTIELQLDAQDELVSASVLGDARIIPPINPSTNQPYVNIDPSAMAFDRFGNLFTLDARHNILMQLDNAYRTVQRLWTFHYTGPHSPTLGNVAGMEFVPSKKYQSDFQRLYVVYHDTVQARSKIDPLVFSLDEGSTTAVIQRSDSPEQCCANALGYGVRAGQDSLSESVSNGPICAGH